MFVVGVFVEQVVPLDNGIIRVKYRLDTWFLYFIKPAEGIEWLRFEDVFNLFLNCTACAESRVWDVLF